jgi:membrane protease YdiL (CAAX protease family)
MVDHPPRSTLRLKESSATERRRYLMKTIKAFIKRHPLLSYFALAFAISWGSMLFAVGLGPGGFSATPQQVQMAVPYAVPAMILGPSVASILLTGLLFGRAGLCEFRSRLLRWRVGARWYAVALLTAPLSIMAVLLALSLLSPEFLPRIFTASDKPILFLMGNAVGLVAGIFEELGWTGFAVPTLLRLPYGVLSTGLIVGVLWGAWHFFVNFWGSGVTSGELSLAIFLPVWLLGTLVGSLTAYRVLMVWVYERTGSLLVAMLMHVSLATFTFILTPPLGGAPYWVIGSAYAAALWVVVAAIAVAQGGHLSRQPLPRRVT